MGVDSNATDVAMRSELGRFPLQNLNVYCDVTFYVVFVRHLHQEPGDISLVS